MIRSLKSKLAFLKNSWGDWTTDRKILVIESDDWGSIRMPDSIAQKQLNKAGVDVFSCPFLSFDNLETYEDFQALNRAFDEVFGRTRKKPVITANYILANPDFDQIRQTNFTEYKREYFWDKLSKENKLSAYKTALNALIENKYLLPQLHGLEHIQVPYWMSRLQEGSSETRLAFDNKVYGVSTTVSSETRETYLAAYNYRSVKEFDDFMRNEIKIAVEEFEKFFGYKSNSFIAPNYVLSERVEEVLAQEGVSYIQSSRYQQLPLCYGEKRIKRFIGQANQHNQRYLVRNAIFEPSTTKNKEEAVQNCLAQIRTAFFFNKPAIMSMHRLNFMGGLSEKNREENLEMLKEILLNITKEFPSVEFLSTPDLGDSILASESI